MKTNSIKIYVLGASGFLGGQFAGYLKQRGFIVFNNRLDVGNLDSMKRVFKNIKPDVVVNFAGVRAEPNIDWCEDHKEETIAVNVVGAINVMTAALEAKAYPIQISSGCVYAGGPEQAFSENDEPNFDGSFYSKMRIVLQKTLVELPVLYARIRMPISSVPHPRNTITKLVGYKEVISIPNSVTLTEDLWPALEKLIEVGPTGIFNLVNEGYTDHKTLLGAYTKYVNPDHSFRLISLEELENRVVKAKRSNCVLAMDKAKNLGINMPELTDEKIEEIMRKYKNNLE